MFQRWLLVSSYCNKIVVMRRNDAKLVKDIPVYNNVFPFILQRRSDSLVFHTLKFDVTKTLVFIRNYNAKKPEIRMKFFYVFVAALMKTIADRPELNRFIANKRYWQRNDLSMTFIIKADYTDEAPETSQTLFFKPEMKLDEYARMIDESINRVVNSEDVSKVDRVASHFFKSPNWVISPVVSFLRLLEKHGKMFKSVRDADGLHASVYVSNLGSIGIDGGSPHHHLYEWGTTSIFVTLGGLERERQFDDTGKVTLCKEKVEVGLTVDERISSGFYFVKSMTVLQNYLSNPELLV